jgi:hypothetical protein
MKSMERPEDGLTGGLRMKGRKSRQEDFQRRFLYRRHLLNRLAAYAGKSKRLYGGFSVILSMTSGTAANGVRGFQNIACAANVRVRLAKRLERLLLTFGDIRHSTA